jgi:hypothetical protein
MRAGRGIPTKQQGRRFFVANTRKFAALAGVRQPVVEETPETDSTAIKERQTKDRGRPAEGKRSNREYERTTVLLKSETKMLANHKIDGMRMLAKSRGKDAGNHEAKIKDLSDLIQHLLEEYVSRHP